ncbi:MAG TPA: hypothetical protein VEC37_19140 [Bacillota bacterium]|nr:hypothetical protein [Bacillota bacterium]
MALENIAGQLIAGKKTWEIKNSLTEQGVEKETASKVVEAVKEKINAQRKKAAYKDMIFGGLWCVGGLIVTVLTYSAASGGGRYVVAWGAILFGGIQFFRGYSKSNDLIY